MIDRDDILSPTTPIENVPEEFFQCELCGYFQHDDYWHCDEHDRSLCPDCLFEVQRRNMIMNVDLLNYMIRKARIDAGRSILAGLI